MVSCRPPTPEMILQSCKDIKEHIDTYSGEANHKYDVFISYAHKNLASAKVFVDTFQKLNPKLKLFFDYDSLKTGKIIQ